MVLGNVWSHLNWLYQVLLSFLHNNIISKVQDSVLPIHPLYFFLEVPIATEISYFPMNSLSYLQSVCSAKQDTQREIKLRIFWHQFHCLPPHILCLFVHIWSIQYALDNILYLRTHFSTCIRATQCQLTEVFIEQAQIAPGISVVWLLMYGHTECRYGLARLSNIYVLREMCGI